MSTFFEDGPLVMALAYSGDHERYSVTEAAEAWENMNRVLKQAGIGTRVERSYTSSNGQEYSYVITGDTLRVYVSALLWESADCRRETGIAHPFSDSASAVLRDNTGPITHKSD